MSNKLSKSDLKEIVRECLLEILTEGVGASPKRKSHVEGARPRRTSFDHASWSRERVDERPVDYSQHARSLTDNPILAEVLADSQRTMTNQIQAEKMGKSAMAGDFAERKVATSDPADLFGDAAGNWAALAFGNE